MFYNKTIAEVTEVIENLHTLFKEYEHLNPEYTNNFEVEPKNLRMSNYHDITVWVKELEEIPHVFIEGLRDIFRRIPANGDVVLTVHSYVTEDEQSYYEDDMWDMELATWGVPVTVEERWGGWSYYYTLTPEDKKRSNKEKWPIYGTLTIRSGLQQITFDGAGIDENIKRLSTYKEATDGLNVLLGAVGQPKIENTVAEVIDSKGLVDDLRSDIVLLQDSINSGEDNTLGHLYSESTLRVYDELVLYFNYGLKQAYLSYNSIGYNYNWNTPSPDKHKELTSATQYTINDLSWKGLSHPGWVSGEDMSGRAVRILKENTATFSTMQRLLEEELEGIFKKPEWRNNYGDGRGVIFSLNILTRGEITNTKGTYRETFFLNEAGQIVATIGGYEDLNVQEAIHRLNSLRDNLGIL